MQSLIDEANLTLEEGTGVPGAAPAGSHDVHVILLHRDSVGGSIGITLAGGSDYESKEITVRLFEYNANQHLIFFLRSRCIKC